MCGTFLSNIEKRVLVVPGGSWWFFLVLGGSWSFFGGSCWFMRFLVVLGGSGWFFVVLGGSWWLLVALGGY